MPGDRLIVSKTFERWACSWYQPARGDETVGWLPVDSLAIAKSREAAASQWLGTWKFHDDTLRVTPGPRAGSLSADGDAYWPSRRSAYPSVHTGNFEAAATPTRNTLVLQDGGCAVRLSLVGELLVASDNHECGGMNVTFDGVYRR
jgi:hypothetical protein